MSLPEKHYTATVYVLSDSTPRKALLVHHRKFDKWLPPGGHQESHENSFEAAIREVKEETGLDVASYFEPPRPASEHARYLPLPQYILEGKIPAHGDEPEHYHLDMEYIVRVPEQAVSRETDKSHDIGWFTLEQLADMPLFGDVRSVLEQELAA